MATIWGSNIDDILETAGDGDIIYGQRGSDDIYGIHAGVKLYGGDGADFIGNYISSDPAGLVSTLYGGAGNDDVIGSPYSDQIYGGTGDDWLVVTGGLDIVAGESGVDILVLQGWSFDPVDIVYTLGSRGTGQYSAAGDGSSVTLYTGIDGLAGGAGNDSLTGNASNNVLYGNDGSDTLRGMAGDDLLNGEDGRDVLTGGSGADLFVFDGGETRAEIRDSADRVTDFNVAEDKFVFFNINFAGLKVDLTDNDGFIQAATQIFGLEAGQFVIQNDRYATTLSARLIYDQDDGQLFYDANGALRGYGPVLVANIGVGLALTEDNFALI